MQSVAKRSSGALEEGSRRFKCEHRRAACQNSAKVSKFSGALEEGSRRFKNASTHGDSLVAIQSAVDEVGRSGTGLPVSDVDPADVDPAALHAKVCNQSRNVPAGRWKKAPEGSKCEQRARYARSCHKFGNFGTWQIP